MFKIYIVANKKKIKISFQESKLVVIVWESLYYLHSHGVSQKVWTPAPGKKS